MHNLKSPIFSFLIILFMFPMFPVGEGDATIETASISNVIFLNGNIITMEPNQSRIEAIALQGDIILALGNESDILEMAGSETIIIDFLDLSFQGR